MTVQERTAWYLSKRLFTKKSLREKLIQEGYSYQEIEETLESFVNDGYLDDDYFIKTYLEEKRRSHPHGYWAYKMDLKRLGIEENHLERLRSEFYPFSEEVKDGVALLRKWFQFGESQKIKLIQRLVRRGFHSDAAEESWSQFQETMEEEQP